MRTELIPASRLLVGDVIYPDGVVDAIHELTDAYAVKLTSGVEVFAGKSTNVRIVKGIVCPACGQLLRAGIVPAYGPNMTHSHVSPATAAVVARVFRGVM